MSKPQSPQTAPQHTTVYTDLVNKLNRLKPVDPLGILGFSFVTLLCFLCFFFLLDYRVFAKGFEFSGQTQRFSWLGIDESGDVKVGFLGGGGEGCDVFNGNWVWDETYPLYESRDCPFIDEGFRCTENGRPDSFYTKWRWQPKDCNLPRFEAKTILEKLRNRRVVFAGDSLGRNQWESLICMLSTAISNKTSIYEVNGSPIAKHMVSLVFKFEDYNCTVEYYRTPFLILQSKPTAEAPKDARWTLKLDQMDWTSGKWRDADILVLNTGHWWNYEKTIRGGCYFQEGQEVKLGMSVESAYQRSIRTLVDWIGREVNTSKTQVFFRTHSPVHFRAGGWKTGGSCHLETLPGLGSFLGTEPKFNIVNQVLSDNANKSQVKELNVLNVTYMSSWRKDAHASLYYLGPNSPASLHRQDCSHWCLPGVPDVWNELLYALFLKREATRTQSVTFPAQPQA